MAIHFNSVRTAVAPVSLLSSNRAHAAASPGAPAAQANSPYKATNPRTTFRTILSGASTPASSSAPPTTTSAVNSIVAALTAPVAAPTPAAASATSPAATPNTPSASEPNAVLTAEQVFGSNPWVTDPTGSGPNGVSFGYNPLYFATPTTAAEVAQMVGGTVVQDNEFTKNTPGDPFVQQQPNEMVQLPGGGLINPGLIASLYTHGLPQWEVNQAIANEVAGAEASVTAT
jgi:hypothetical protein